MGNKEEAEWILERLTETLSRELEALRREELEREGDQGNEMTKETPGNGKASSSEGMQKSSDERDAHKS